MRSALQSHSILLLPDPLGDSIWCLILPLWFPLPLSFWFPSASLLYLPQIDLPPGLLGPPKCLCVPHPGASRALCDTNQPLQVPYDKLRKLSRKHARAMPRSTRWGREGIQATCRGHLGGIFVTRTQRRPHVHVMGHTLMARSPGCMHARARVYCAHVHMCAVCNAYKTQTHARARGLMLGCTTFSTGAKPHAHTLHAKIHK